jgi:hypothetical protein
MKTKTNTRHACILAFVLWAAFVSGPAVFAQSEPEEFNSDEVIEAFVRLDALMVAIEETVRYVPPSAESDDIRSAWERLDLLAVQIENETMYRAPELDGGNAVEFANVEKKPVAEENKLLSDIKKPDKQERPR